MMPQFLSAQGWLEAHLKRRNDAAGCLFVALASLALTVLIFIMQGYALWISSGAGAHFRHDLLLWAQIATLLMVGFYGAMALYGWRYYRVGDSHRTAAYLLSTAMLTNAAAVALLYGLHDTPMGVALLAAVALARAWFPARVLSPGLVLGGIVLATAEVLTQRGIMPYAPLLSAPVVTGGAVAPWWMAWFMAIYYLMSLFFAVLMLCMFAIMDRHHAELEALARVDALTGLFNRATFTRLLEEQGAKQRRTKRAACVMMCDVDHFKGVNDRYGHAAGDLVLVRMGHLLRQLICYPVDVAARYGGEEFVVLLPEADLEAALAIAGQLREQLREQVFEFDGHRFSVTISIGVAEYRKGDGSAALKAADANLYQAKNEGRDRIVASAAG